MKTFFLSLAGAFVALVLFCLVSLFALIGFVASAGASDPQPRDLVLTLDLRVPYADQAPASGFEALSGRPGFIDILSRIDAAASDPAVKGLFIRGTEGSIGSSRAEELRDALHAFRQAGKFVIAHSQGIFSTGPSALRAITAADEIWLQPGTDIMTAGITFETLFLKDLFDNISVVPEIEAFYEYKNAPNAYKEADYTGPHREAMTALAQSLWDTSLDDLSADRGIDRQALAGLFDASPTSAEAALEAGLVDMLGWPEDALESARTRGGEHALLDIGAYRTPSLPARAPQIAVVGGEGPIVTGGSSGGVFADAPAFASDPIAEAIIAAGANERVQAVVFRVDSPGGSPTASDQIWNAIERVQADGKPVVVSMGSLAASGGYYVSTGADYILASRTTVTGSIGIFGGKQSISGGLERIGINPRTISVGGPFADAYDSDPFTDGQRTEVIASLKRGYDRFVSLVADGRGMSVEEVDAVARGRLWSGADAIDRGLVDQLGGYLDAIGKAKELAGIDPDTQVRLIPYPARKSGLEALEGLFGASSEAARAASMLGLLTGDERLNAAIRQMRLLSSGPAHAVGPVLIEH